MHGSTRSHHAREPVGWHVTTGRLRPGSPVPRPALAVTYLPSGQDCPVLPSGWPGAGSSTVSAPAQRVRARARIISHTVADPSPDRPGFEACKSVPSAASANRARRYPADIRVSSGSLMFFSLLMLLCQFFSCISKGQNYKN